jgi:heterodisulfide reductase subunit A
MHEETFRQWASEMDVNPFCVDMVNVREHIAWAQDDKEKATEAALAVMKGAVAKARLTEPLEPKKVPVEKSCLVVGGGVAGIQAALDVADNGFKVYLLDKEPSIGGKMAQLDKTFPTLDCSACILTPKMVDAARHPNIELVTYAEVKDVSGHVGDFNVRVNLKPRYIDMDKCVGCGLCATECRMAGRIDSEFDMDLGKRGAAYIPFPQAVPLKYLIDPETCLMLTKGKCGKSPKCVDACAREAVNFEDTEKEIDLHVGTIILSTGYDFYDPAEKPNLGLEHEGVITGMDFERLVNASGPTGGEFLINEKKPKKAAFIQCVGSRERDGNQYCSRYCCMYTAKQAHMIHEKMHGGETVVYYTDMRAYGKGFEEFFTRVRAEGIDYRRRELDEDLLITKENGGIVVKAKGHPDYHCDLVVLSNGGVATADSGFLADTFKIKRSGDGFFQEQHPSLRPVDAMHAGIFLAGCAQGLKDIPDSVAQASGAAAQAVGILGKDHILTQPPTAGITRAKCSSCLSCVRVCPYDAINHADGTYIDVIPVLCEGCGLCTAECPGKAITLPNNEDRHILASLETVMSIPADGSPAVAFICDHGAYEAADMGGMLGMRYPHEFRTIRVPCTGKVEVEHILRAIEGGAGAVAVVGCKDGNCSHRTGSDIARIRVNEARKLLSEIGLDEERVKMFNVSTSLADEFVNVAKLMVQKAKEVDA